MLDNFIKSRIKCKNMDKKVDTNEILPTTRAVEVVNVFREDSVESTLDREAILEQAPNREGDFFRVPRILSE